MVLSMKAALCRRVEAMNLAVFLCSLRSKGSALSSASRLLIAVVGSAPSAVLFALLSMVLRGLILALEVSWFIHATAPYSIMGRKKDLYSSAICLVFTPLYGLLTRLISIHL